MTYIEAMEKDLSITVFEEQLTHEQIFLEKIMLGLRRSIGMSYEQLTHGLTIEQAHTVREKIQWLQEKGSYQ